MRLLVLLGVGALAWAQPPDPAYEPLARAYAALKAKDYDAAVAGFRAAGTLAPDRASIHKDLAYTYLKIGENELARREFGEAMRLNAGDEQVAMEFAFLSYESKEQAVARRIFDRIRKTGNRTAEQAFQNIDRPLAAGIARWQEAIRRGADNFSSHHELARLAEQRDELALAAEHYSTAWRLEPERRMVLVDLARVWTAMGRAEGATAALLAASRGPEPRCRELARESLPARYPFVAEFQRAAELDPRNIALRRELAYLLLKIGRQTAAESEFGRLVEQDGDLLAATQLGFLLRARGERAAAQALFDRVLAGGDEELANRVRAVLRVPQEAKPGDDGRKQALDAKEMAERSYKAGYLKDALNYLQQANEADPADYAVMLRLGWTYNMLHQDVAAYRYFGMARLSSDPRISAEARKAWLNLRSVGARVRVTGWMYPIFSTRWHDLFGYGQVRLELRTGLPLVLYSSVRLVGDTRLTIGAISPVALSESSLIFAGGVRSLPWHGITGWFEAGSAVGYMSGHALPDYRGGLSMTRGWGHSMGAETGGWFTDTSLDGVFVSRFGDDFLAYSHTRVGYTLGPSELRTQIVWTGNLTLDDQRQYWANFVETGPGIRIHTAWMPPPMYIGLDAMRGAYLIHDGNPGRPNFNDVRMGIWYAFVH
ncbi:MAG: tetratricopeptide repeat protein [Bryobacteraceae bacterium]|jgi:Flp pilus assembly protein TadD